MKSLIATPMLKMRVTSRNSIQSQGACGQARPLAFNKPSFSHHHLSIHPRIHIYTTLFRKTAPLRVPPCAAEPTPEKFEKDNKQYSDLAQKIEAEAALAAESLQGTSIYLVGMMGSGKSTIGKMLSQALGYCFFDTDTLIEQLAGKTIPEIFSQDGEADFRQLETQVVAELSPFKNCIISTGGGAATKAENWGHMQAGISIWLHGPPTLLANRVLRDGIDSRPLLSDKDVDVKSEKESENTSGDIGIKTMEVYEKTVEKLSALLQERKEQYGFADIVVSLEGEDSSTSDLGAPAAVMVLRVLSAVNDRIRRDAEYRKERMNFEVVNENLPESMRVVKSINPLAAADNDDPFMP